jgi:hypothetical protein
MKALQADAPLILDSGLSDLVVKRAEKYEPEFFCEVIHILSLIKGKYPVQEHLLYIVFFQTCELTTTCKR